MGGWMGGKAILRIAYNHQKNLNWKSNKDLISYITQGKIFKLSSFSRTVDFFSDFSILSQNVSMS